MKTNTTILDKSKKYFFCAFHGIDINTIKKLKLDKIGIKYIELFSRKYNKLVKEIHLFENSFPEEFSNFKLFENHKYSLLFYSENENLIDDFLDFIILLRPSNIRKWIEFETYFPKYEQESLFNGKHTTYGETIWNLSINLHLEFYVENLFRLNKADIYFANNLLDKYKSYSNTKAFKHFISLYRRAYIEKISYFKFLLLFIIIESFIPADDKMGVTYKIRRFCAIIAGESKEYSKIIYEKINHAYKVRSLFVHSAKNNLSDSSYLLFINSVVCELGILIILAKIDLKTIFDITTTMGFGQRNLLIEDPVFKKYSTISANLLNFHLLSIKK